MENLSQYLNGIERYLPFDKISNDFYEYLVWAEQIEKVLPGQLVVDGVDETYHNSKKIVISKSDLITIMYYKSINDVFDISYAPVVVGIAIGKFEAPDKAGLYCVEKCLANLNYNDDLSLVSVDFYYNSLFCRTSETTENSKYPEEHFNHFISMFVVNFPDHDKEDFENMILLYEQMEGKEAIQGLQQEIEKIKYNDDWQLFIPSTLPSNLTVDILKELAEKAVKFNQI